MRRPRATIVPLDAIRAANHFANYKDLRVETFQRNVVVKIPLPSLEHAALALLQTEVAASGRGYCELSYPEIGRRLEVKTRTAISVVGRLEGRGFVRTSVRHDRRGNLPCAFTTVLPSSVRRGMPSVPDHLVPAFERGLHFVNPPFRFHNYGCDPDDPAIANPPIEQDASADAREQDRPASSPPPRRYAAPPDPPRRKHPPRPGRSSRAAPPAATIEPRAPPEVVVPAIDPSWPLEAQAIGEMLGAYAPSFPGMRPDFPMRLWAVALGRKLGLRQALAGIEAARECATSHAADAEDWIIRNVRRARTHSDDPQTALVNKLVKRVEAEKDAAREAGEAARRARDNLRPLPPATPPDVPHLALPSGAEELLAQLAAAGRQKLPASAPPRNWRARLAALEDSQAPQSHVRGPAGLALDFVTEEAKDADGCATPTGRRSRDGPD